MKAGFGAYQIDSDIPELRRDGDLVPVEPKVFDILFYLIQHRDRVVSKDELIDAVWDGRVISDAAVTSRINLVRQAVGDTGRLQQVIQTVPKRGFRFVAPVTAEAANTPAPTAPSDQAGASILVLPFTDLTPETSNFLAEGLTEDLIVAFSRYRDVAVISHNTATRLKERQSLLENPLAEIEAQYLITGTVRVTGDRIRVTVQLSDKATGANIAAERFDRDSENILTVQDEIVSALSGYMPWRVIEAEGRRLAATNPPRLSSYQAFVRAGYEARVHRDIHRAEADYRAIIQGDPAFGPARAALAFLLGYKVFFTGQQTQDDIDQSLDHGRAALKLSADNEMVLSKCAMVFQFAGQFSVARRLVDQAIRQNANSTECTHFMGTILAASGEAERAMEYHRQTMALDPLFPEEHFEGMIEALYLLGRYDEALDLISRWSNPPQHTFAYGAACSAMAGDLDGAQGFAQEFAARAPEGYSNAAFVSAMLRYHKRREDRDRWLTGFETAGIPGLNGLRDSGILDASPT